MPRHRALLIALSAAPYVVPFGRLRPSVDAALESLHAKLGGETPPADGAHTMTPRDELLLGSCVDDHKECARWARDGECDANPGFMAASCRESCYGCQSTKCHDDASECAGWAAAGECSSNHNYMLTSCRYSCRVCRVNFKAECRRDPTMEPAAIAGTIDETMRLALERYRASPPTATFSHHPISPPSPCASRSRGTNIPRASPPTATFSPTLPHLPSLSIGTLTTARARCGRATRSAQITSRGYCRLITSSPKRRRTTCSRRRGTTSSAHLQATA